MTSEPQGEWVKFVDAQAVLRERERATWEAAAKRVRFIEPGDPGNEVVATYFKYQLGCIAEAFDALAAKAREGK